jgi:two-component system, LytTR family, response regulator
MSTQYKAIIIDDEELARSLVSRYLESFPTIEVVAACSNGFEGLKAIEQHQPHLVFLDIQMPKLTGFEMLELLDKKPMIIFTTAYDAFAIKAFEENALDYLLKPFSAERFEKAVNKALGQLNQVTNNSKKDGTIPMLPTDSIERIAIKQGTKIHIIPSENIDYLEAHGDYVLIHTPDGRYIKEKTMKYYESNLNQQQFVRIHRSFIVNVNRIARIENFEKESHLVILKNDVRLKVSSEGYKLLKQYWG